MTEWIRLEPVEINKSERSNLGQIEIAVGLSPYDVPDGVRGYYSPTIKRFIIDFKYLNSPTEQLTPHVPHDDDEVSLITGKRSGRLYSIVIDVEKIKAKRVGLRFEIVPEIDDALASLEQEPWFKTKARHYQLAREVVRRRKDELLAGI